MPYCLQSKGGCNVCLNAIGQVLMKPFESSLQWIHFCNKMASRPCKHKNESKLKHGAVVANVHPQRIQTDCTRSFVENIVVNSWNQQVSISPEES